MEKDFEKFVELLNKHEVKYIIVGGYAVAFHAEPRNTKDIDILVEPSSENAKRIMIVLNEFGFGDIGIVEQDFLDKDTVVQLGYSPIRIDILSSIKGLGFEHLWNKRVSSKFGEQTAYFISLDDLIKNKKSTGRLQDIADAEVLEKFERTKENDKDLK